MEQLNVTFTPVRKSFNSIDEVESWYEVAIDGLAKLAATSVAQRGLESLEYRTCDWCTDLYVSLTRARHHAHLILTGQPPNAAPMGFTQMLARYVRPVRQ